MAINKDEISLDREALKAAAADYHAQGFNCAQSVICAMAPKLGLDDHTAFALAEGFGAGMGGMTETCGAIAGGIMALGPHFLRSREITSGKKFGELSISSRHNIGDIFEVGTIFHQLDKFVFIDNFLTCSIYQNSSFRHILQ